MINHIVLLAFKKELSEDEINFILNEMGNLSYVIPEIKSFTSGCNCSPEELHKNFTHAFIMQFENTQARDKYLEHSEHKRIAQEMVMPALQDDLNSVLAFDYEV